MEKPPGGDPGPDADRERLRKVREKAYAGPDQADRDRQWREVRERLAAEEARAEKQFEPIRRQRERDRALADARADLATGGQFMTIGLAVLALEPLIAQRYAALAPLLIVGGALILAVGVYYSLMRFARFPILEPSGRTVLPARIISVLAMLAIIGGLVYYFRNAPPSQSAPTPHPRTSLQPQAHKTR